MTGARLHEGPLASPESESESYIYTDTDYKFTVWVYDENNHFSFFAVEADKGREKSLCYLAEYSLY